MRFMRAKPDHHAALARDGAARQPGAGAAAHHRDAGIRAAILTMRGNVRGGARKDHQVGPVLFHAAVVFVERQIFGTVQVAARPQRERGTREQVS